jgi:hypothetical protein
MTGTCVPPTVAAPAPPTARRRRIRCVPGTGRLPVVGTTRLEPAGGEAAAAGACAMPGAASLGTSRTGNRAAGSTTSGTGTTVAGGSTIDLIAAPIRLPYGSARASSPRTPNQNRFRRELNMPQPAEGRNPPYEVPAYAGLVVNRSRVPSEIEGATPGIVRSGAPHISTRSLPQTTALPHLSAWPQPLALLPFDRPPTDRREGLR